MGGDRNASPLQNDVRHGRPGSGILQQHRDIRGGRPEAPSGGHYHRRAGGSDDGRRQGGGGFHLPHCADGSCRRYAPDYRHPASLRQRYHRFDEGEYPVPNRVLRCLRHGIPHHSGYHGRGKAGGQGRYAVCPHRLRQAAACAGLFCHRHRGRGRGRVCQGQLHGGLQPAGAGRDREKSPADRQKAGERLRPRPHRRGAGGRRNAARRRRCDSGDRTGFRLHAPAPSEAGLCPRGANRGRDGRKGHCRPLPGFQAESHPDHEGTVGVHEGRPDGTDGL